LIEHCISRLSAHRRGPGVSQAIDNALRDPALNAESFGQMSGMKRLWQIVRQKG
jgi:hypothetical protein